MNNLVTFQTLLVSATICVASTFQTQGATGCEPKNPISFSATESPETRTKSVYFGDLFRLPSGVSDWGTYDFADKGVTFSYTNSNPDLIAVTQCGYSQNSSPRNVFKYEIGALKSGQATLTVSCHYNGVETQNSITVDITPAGDNPFTPNSNVNIYNLGGTRNSTDIDKEIPISEFFTLPDGWNVADNWEKLGITYGGSSDNTAIVSDISTIVKSNKAYLTFTLHPVNGVCNLTAWIERNGVRKESHYTFEQYDVKCYADEIYTQFAESGRVNLISNDKYLNDSFISVTLVNQPSLGIVEMEKRDNGFSKEWIARYTFNGPSDTPDWTEDQFRYRLSVYSDEAKTQLVGYDEADVKVTLYSNFGASSVIEAVSGPGQYTNVSYYDFESLVGAYGSMTNTAIPSRNTLVSLGSFGGYVILGFSKPIYNDSRNPYGVDFSIAGNAMKPIQKGMWSEPASVMVMRDDNGNGLPDDTWYELAGSDYWWSTTRRNVSAKYDDSGNLPAAKGTVTYTLSDGKRGAIYGNFPTKNFYPLAPDNIYGDGTLALEGSMLTGVYDMRCPAYVGANRALAFGYADNHVAQKDLCTPHNPYYVDENGAVADGFDISWAVDKDGNYVDLDRIDFIKIYNATGDMCGTLGESSAEISAVAVTRPNPSLTEPKDYYLNYAGISQNMVPVGSTCLFEGLAFKNGRPIRDAQTHWNTLDTSIAEIDNNGLLRGKCVGRVSLVFSATDLASPDTITVDIVELTKVVIPNLTGQLYTSPMRAYVGETHRIAPQTETSNAYVINNQAENRYVYDTYEWECTDNTIIDLTQDGFFKALKAGTCTVIVSSKTNPNLTATLDVTVSDLPEPQSKYRYLDFCETNYTSQSTLTNNVYSVGDLLETADKRSEVSIVNILPEGYEDKFYWENDSLKNRLSLGDYREYMITLEVRFNDTVHEITIPAFHYLSTENVPVLQTNQKNIQVDIATLTGKLDLTEVFTFNGYAPELYEYSFRTTNEENLPDGTSVSIENNIINVKLSSADIFEAKPEVTVEGCISRGRSSVIRQESGDNDNQEINYEHDTTWHTVNLPIVKVDFSGIGLINDDEESLRIYPNPASYAFTLNVNQATELEIYTQSGASMGSYILCPGEAINITDYLPGMYIVYLPTTGHSFKLVKK